MFTIKKKTFFLLWIDSTPKQTNEIKAYKKKSD